MCRKEEERNWARKDRGARSWEALGALLGRTGFPWLAVGSHGRFAHGQRTWPEDVCSSLSSSPLEAIIKPTKPTEGTRADFGCFIHELSIGQVKNKN